MTGVNRARAEGRGSPVNVYVKEDRLQETQLLILMWAPLKMLSAQLKILTSTK